jgi:hypothetical protein
MLLEWARAVRCELAAPPPVLAPPLDGLLRALTLASPLGPALQLLYGAHLLGSPGVSPAELYAVLGESLPPARRWREALGTGELAARSAAALQGSLLRLSPELRRFLDERSPRHGTLLGIGGTPRTTPAAVVCDPFTVDPFRLATAAGSPLLMVTRAPTSSADLRGVALEAQLRGATAVIPYPRYARHPGLDPLPDIAAVYLVPSMQIAASLGIELLVL